MNKVNDAIELHSKGERLYVNPADIIASKQGRQALTRFKELSIDQAVKKREEKPSSAA